MGSRVPTGIEPGTTLIPYISHLSVFYSPGENCDSLPAYTKLSLERKWSLRKVTAFSSVSVLVKTATVSRYIPNFPASSYLVVEGASHRSAPFQPDFSPGENLDSLPAHTKLSSGDLKKASSHPVSSEQLLKMILSTLIWSTFCLEVICKATP